MPTLVCREGYIVQPYRDTVEVHVQRGGERGGGGARQSPRHRQPARS